MHVFVTDFSSVSPPELAKWPTCFSSSEQGRLENMLSPKRQKEFITGHFLARCALATYLKCAPTQIVLETLQSGAVIVADHPDVYLSLSHSNNALALAVARQPVGLDIEWIRPKENFEELLGQIDSLPQAHWLMQKGCTLGQAFYMLWTKREAKYKLQTMVQELVNPVFYYRKQGHFQLCLACQFEEPIHWKSLSLDTIRKLLTKNDF